MTKLIVGCGYVGQRLAQRWLQQGEQVYATTRNPKNAKQLAASGVIPILWDVTQDNSVVLPPVETIVFAVGFDRDTANTAGHTIEDVYVAGLRRLLKVCPQADRFIYVSSTGVYGQSDDAWVDEESACEPNREGGRACLAAELLLQSDTLLKGKAIVLRLAGIYGPDRLPQAALLQRGEPLAVAADGFLNLVHVDDIVEIIVGCEGIQPPQKLCVSDGAPVRRGDFYNYLAELLGADEPTFEPPATGSSRAARARGSKRIRNERLVGLLGYQFLYPSFREGLAAIVGRRPAHETQSDCNQD